MGINEKLDGMSRERLERFALNAIGYISGTEGFADKHPKEAFNFIYEIGEDKTGDNNDEFYSN